MIRFSNLSRLEVCPASHAESEGMPSVSGADAQRGTKTHAALELAFRGAELPPELGITRQEMLEVLSSIAPGCWSTERPISLDLGDGLVVNGTPDLTNEVETLILDWKDEHQESIHPKDRVQLLGYAVALAAERMTNTAKAVLFNLPQKKATVHEMNADEIQAVKDRIRLIVTEAQAQVGLPVERRKYATGDHCGYCPARPTCPALAATRREALALVGQAGSIDLPRDRYPWLYGALRGIVQACERMMDQLKSSIEFEGPVEADGQVLRLTSRMVSPSKTWKAAKEVLVELGHAAEADQVEAVLDARPKVEQKAINLGKVKEAK